VIARHQALATIHNEHKEIGILDRSTAALEHEGMQRILTRAEHAAGVGEIEVRPLPFNGIGDDVSRGAWNCGHD
jgi:hypothetical protein